jgi:hypothetical protein
LESSLLPPYFEEERDKERQRERERERGKKREDGLFSNFEESVVSFPLIIFGCLSHAKKYKFDLNPLTLFEN